MTRDKITMAFRGATRTFPVESFATAFRVTPRHALRALDTLVFGPAEFRPQRSASPAHPTVVLPPDPIASDNRRDPASSVPPASTSHGEGGKGGGAQDQALQQHSETSCLEEKTSRNNANKNNGDGVYERKGDTVSAESLVAALGTGTNRVAIHRLVLEHPPALLEEALRRTLAIPDARVQTSRGALFTGIVRRLARDGWMQAHS